MRTSQPEDTDLPCYALGLAGEAGEVVDMVKKHLYHGHALDRQQVAEELGDLLWYVAGLCDVLSLNLDTVMAANLSKLRRRYPDGFSREASQARATREASDE